MSSGKALSEGEQKMHARVYDAQIKQLGRARSGLTGAVYLALCRRGRLNKDTGLRQCWPFLKQICEDAGGASERTVRRSLDRLEGAGLIRVEPHAGPQKSGQRSSRYTVLDEAAIGDRFDATPF